MKDDMNDPIFIGGSYHYSNGDIISESDAIEGLSTMPESQDDPVEETMISGDRT